MRIYVAGPYSLGNREANVRDAIDAGTSLLALGHAPLVPHLNHYWNQRAPHPEATWLALDRAWLAVADAVLRLPGLSAGADEECALATRLGLPVYVDLGQVPGGDAR